MITTPTATPSASGLIPTASQARVYHEGRADALAHHYRQPPRNCPYLPDTDAAHWWQRGYDEALGISAFSAPAGAAAPASAPSTGTSTTR